MMKKMMVKLQEKVTQCYFMVRILLSDRKGDQITSWLIVLLVVVVAGAAFLTIYQSGIQDIWSGIIKKMKAAFSLT